MYLDLLSRVALSFAECGDLGNTLSLIVDGLVGDAGFALARIWMIEDAAKCGGCRHPEVCGDRGKCLQLRASAGRSIVDRSQSWNGLDGRFSRFPLGSRKIGQVAATGKPVILADLASEAAWVADAAWVAREKLVSFAAHPLIFKGETLGVLGIFSRQRMSTEELEGVRLFTGQAAISISNSSRFEELQDLRRKLELENTYLQEEVKEAMAFSDIVGHSPALVRILQEVDLVASTDASVLILGESGTGKELIARAIHERSKRHARPLVKVNCASIPRELFESEFFGHVKGSFTGAIKDRVGRFQLADQGTLFLDEVGEIPLELQSKLLRVLQEGEFERVGEDATRRVNVRVIAATNRELGREAEGKRFREDLYYRLSVFPIVVPSLRERREDIPLLAAHFIRHSCRRMGLPEPRLLDRHVKMLMAYDWPGNIRELQHVIERAVILGRGQSLHLDLPDQSPTPTPAVSPSSVLTMDELRALETENYRRALKQAGGKIYGTDGAAALLGLPATTLASRLKALGIHEDH
ncbi:MAG: sigma 54-interacting transcriptional regulator [Acidobacteria bacterium]|nr:sigma 54-interacting transcriptional regulator [Acidobacteriota bacterium]